MIVKEHKEVNGMLLQFKFKNFRSFADETVLNMMATNIREHSDTLIEKNKNNVLPVAAVYGANASGKTNLFLAFHTMRNKVLEKELTERNTRITPYLFSKETIQMPTEYEVSVNIGSTEYRYGFECNKDEILSEWLYNRPFRKGTKSSEKIIFERSPNLSIGKEVDDIQKREIDFCNSMIESKNQLLLNIIGIRGKSDFKKVYGWFMNSFTVNCSNDKEEIFNMNINAEFKEDIRKFIQEIDPSIINVFVDSYKDKELNQQYKYMTIHKTDLNEETTLPIDLESSGTKKILSLSLLILANLNVGGTLFIDELDAKLHPLLLRRIVQMFTDKETNTGKGQLVFSSHNLICLDSSDLRRDEIWFVEKKDQKSSLFSLYDFTDYNETTVRSDLSFGKHYLAGRFGAVPFQKEEQ